MGEVCRSPSQGNLILTRGQCEVEAGVDLLPVTSQLSAEVLVEIVHGAGLNHGQAQLVVAISVSQRHCK